MKFLIIRNDNIGDLACTTPLLQLLRDAYPQATIDVLGNSYNVDLLRYDPRVSRLWSYDKAKHFHNPWQKIKAWLSKTVLLGRLRIQHYDTVIIAVPLFNRRTTRLASLIKPKVIYGAPSEQYHVPKNYHPVSINHQDPHALQVVTYARALGIQAPAPESMTLYLSEEEKSTLLSERASILGDLSQPIIDKHSVNSSLELSRTTLDPLFKGIREQNNLENKNTTALDRLSSTSEKVNYELRTANYELTVIGLHISARRPKQQWSLKQWQQLISELLRLLPSDKQLPSSISHLPSSTTAAVSSASIRLRLLWSPGSTENLQHPGDDLLASQLVASFPPGLLLAKPTTHLRSLMVAFSGCDLVVGPDGGAMHIAAGLNVPTLTLFGDIDPLIWRPYSKKGYEIVSPSGSLSDLSPEEVAKKICSLLLKIS
ncbi:MAG TPA: glycosyltransferase family 9 protein [Chthoniobacterales bacterium]|nr:glycosyltransferase family 9 protein [Chthoniobacterales bacterium]